MAFYLAAASNLAFSTLFIESFGRLNNISKESDVLASLANNSNFTILDFDFLVSKNLDLPIYKKPTAVVRPPFCYTAQ